MDGFILIHRKVLESWVWQKSEHFQWFVYLIFKANFKDNDKFLFEGQFTKVKRGQFVTSYRNLARELPRCSEQKVRTFLKLAQKAGAIQIKNLKKATQITICNYDSYQGGQHSTNTVSTQYQHSTNNNRKNDNKEKERKRSINSLNFDFIFELNLNGTTETFIEIAKEWVDYRKEIKKPLKAQKSLEAFFKQLLHYSKGNTQTAKNIIDKSIAAGYQGIFELKQQSTKQTAHTINGNSRREIENDPDRNRI